MKTTAPSTTSPPKRDRRAETIDQLGVYNRHRGHWHAFVDAQSSSTVFDALAAIGVHADAKRYDYRGREISFEPQRTPEIVDTVHAHEGTFDLRPAYTDRERHHDPLRFSGYYEAPGAFKARLAHIEKIREALGHVRLEIDHEYTMDGHCYLRIGKLRVRVDEIDGYEEELYELEALGDLVDLTRRLQKLLE